MADDQERLPGHPAAGEGSDAAPCLIMWRVPSDATISAGMEKIFISERDILIHLIRKGGNDCLQIIEPSEGHLDEDKNIRSPD